MKFFIKDIRYINEGFVSDRQFVTLRFLIVLFCFKSGLKGLHIWVCVKNMRKGRKSQNYIVYTIYIIIKKRNNKHSRLLNQIITSVNIEVTDLLGSYNFCFILFIYIKLDSLFVVVVYNKRCI